MIRISIESGFIWFYILEHFLSFIFDIIVSDNFIIL